MRSNKALWWSSMPTDVCVCTCDDDVFADVEPVTPDAASGHNDHASSDWFQELPGAGRTLIVSTGETDSRVEAPNSPCCCRCPLHARWVVGQRVVCRTSVRPSASMTPLCRSASGRPVTN